MPKQLISLIGILSLALSARPQVVLQLNAGSRASWGTNQDLFIDQQGHCRYYLNEVNGKKEDSSFFSVPAVQIDSLLTKAQQLGFFGLNEKYDAGRADGAGIFISLSSSGKKHSVDLRNEDLPAIHELVDRINRILAPHRIRINYGQ